MRVSEQYPESRTRGLQHFEPGKSGNVEGRKSIATLIRESADRECSVCGQKHSFADNLVHLAFHADRSSVRLDATTAALDRIYGKPMQTHLVAESSELDAQLDALPIDMLRALIQAASPAIDTTATVLPDQT